jgi:hypothetical protein
MKILSRNDSMIFTCYHEAGHIIVGSLMFFNITYVIIKTSMEGDTNYETIDNNIIDNCELLYYHNIANINMYYAGIISERILYKDITGSNILPRSLERYANYDMKNVSSFLMNKKLVKPGTSTYIFKKKIVNLLNKLMLKYWSDVKLIAHALYNNRKLYHYDIRNILTKKSVNKKFWKQQFKYINSYLYKKKKLNLNDIKFLIRKYKSYVKY